VAAVENDTYSNGGSDISVTGLIAPAYQRRLRQTVEPIEDAAERLYALYGQIGHGILERAGLRVGSNVETRLFTTMCGWKISGQYDLYEDGIIYDYKFASVWSVKGEPKKEWVQQLNLLRFLADANGMFVSGLRIIALLRDHSMTQAQRDRGYPQLPIAAVDIPMWDLDEAERFLYERVVAHQEANPEPCSDEERWKSPSTFAVRKEGRKKAVKLYDLQADAEQHAAEAGKGHFVEVRPGNYRRCAEFCNVSHGCPVYANTQREAQIDLEGL
jgi:hypothetical protein